MRHIGIVLLLAFALGACSRTQPPRVAHELVITAAAKNDTAAVYTLRSIEYPPLYYTATVGSCQIADPVVQSKNIIYPGVECPLLQVGQHVMTYDRNVGYPGMSDLYQTEFQATIKDDARSYILTAQVETLAP